MLNIVIQSFEISNLFRVSNLVLRISGKRYVDIYHLGPGLPEIIARAGEFRVYIYFFCAFFSSFSLISWTSLAACSGVFSPIIID